VWFGWWAEVLLQVGEAVTTLPEMEKFSCRCSEHIGWADNDVRGNCSQRIWAKAVWDWLLAHGAVKLEL
jgi:hypothetical protein